MLAVGVREEANSAFYTSTIVILYTKPYLYKLSISASKSFPSALDFLSQTQGCILPPFPKQPREKNIPNPLCHHLTEEESVLATQQKVAVAGHLSPASSRGLLPLALRTPGKP